MDFLKGISGTQGQTRLARTEFHEAQDKQVKLETEATELEAQRTELRSQVLSGEKVIESFRVTLQETQQGVRNKETEIQEMGFQIEQARRSKEMAGSLFTENQIREKVFPKILTPSPNV